MTYAARRRPRRSQTAHFGMRWVVLVDKRQLAVLLLERNEDRSPRLVIGRAVIATAKPAGRRSGAAMSGGASVGFYAGPQAESSD